MESVTWSLLKTFPHTDITGMNGAKTYTLLSFSTRDRVIAENFSRNLLFRQNVPQE